MAGIALLNGDDVKKSAAADLVAPDPPDIGDARLFDLVPDHGGAEYAESKIIARRPGGLRAGQDRIVAMEQGLHMDHGVAHGSQAVVGVIARPLAERPLLLRLAGDAFP